MAKKCALCRCPIAAADRDPLTGGQGIILAIAGVDPVLIDHKALMALIEPAIQCLYYILQSGVTLVNLIAAEESHFSSGALQKAQFRKRKKEQL